MTDPAATVTRTMSDLGPLSQGVVVAHQGAIVGEWYAPGADATSFAASWSVGKSFTSALIGIAIEEGHIPDVDVPMTTYYPQWAGTAREGRPPPARWVASVCCAVGWAGVDGYDAW